MADEEIAATEESATVTDAALDEAAGIPDKPVAEEEKPEEAALVEEKESEAEPEPSPLEKKLEEPVLDIPPAAPSVDLSEPEAVEQIPPETEVPPISTEADVLAGMSEERVEAIITKVVQESVERVARETMVTVAEKLITEAIDALKQSLEAPSQ